MSEEYDYENPDPACYRLRAELALPPEVAQAVGIVERWWEPLDEHDQDVAAYTDGLARQPVLSLQDIRHYKPLQMLFGLPTPARGTEFTDDWFEQLLSVLRHLVDELGDRAFGTAAAAPMRASGIGAGIDASSPWGAVLPTAFVLYAGDVAATDANDGGWDALLLDAVQRAALVKGVLAKLLDEHVLSDLLFGGTAHQKQLLAHLDATMLTSDGFVRKLKRCEQVQRILAQDTLSAHFWDAVDRVTADTAQMLLPIVNLQRHMLIAARSKSDDTTVRAPPLGLCAWYQGLYDIVAVAGYASLHMARSTSIFQIDFPEADQLWDVDQHRADDDPVYASSVRKARAVDTKRTMAGAYDTDDDDDGCAAPTRVDKVKIVVWPRTQRFKPVWNHARDTVKSATRTCISKSHDLYYCGEADASSTSFDEDEKRAGGYAGCATLDLFAHIEQVKAARAKARRYKAGVSCMQWLLAVCVLYVVLPYLRAWHDAGGDEVRRLVAAHAMLMADSATSACYVALDTARAAPGHAIAAADHFVDTVVKPALDGLPSKEAILDAVRKVVSRVLL